MISIIISSYQPHYFSALEKNIAETCGVPYEIIQIFNPGLMGICKAYNKGAAQAKYENLLFLHEDVKFETLHWGKIIIKKLSKSEIGILGLAGSDYLPNAPAIWWNFSDHNFINIIQYNRDKLVQELILKRDKEVFLLDGVLLAMRSEVYKEFKFNEKITGFHAYDIDISARVSSKYKNIVCSNVCLIHYSQGNAGKEWLQALIQSRNYYKVNKKTLEKTKEYWALKTLLLRMENLEFSRLKVLKTILLYANPNIIGYKGTYYFIKRFIKTLNWKS